MSHVIIFVPLLVVITSQEPSRPSTTDLHHFEAARAEAGSDPAKLVKLALWCDARGMRAEKRGCWSRPSVPTRTMLRHVGCLARSRTWAVGRPPKPSRSR